MRPDERSLMTLNVKNKETHQLGIAIANSTNRRVSAANFVEAIDASRDPIATAQR